MIKGAQLLYLIQFQWKKKVVLSEQCFWHSRFACVKGPNSCSLNKNLFWRNCKKKHLLCLVKWKQMCSILHKYCIRTKYCSCLYTGNFPSHLLSVPKKFVCLFVCFFPHSSFLALFPPPPPLKFSCSLEWFVFNLLLSSLEKDRLAEQFYYVLNLLLLSLIFSKVYLN